jgi:hypothetical protein
VVIQNLLSGEQVSRLSMGSVELVLVVTLSARVAWIASIYGWLVVIDTLAFRASKIC